MTFPSRAAPTGPTRQAPYGADGGLQFHPHVEHHKNSEGLYSSTPPEWRAIVPFRAALTFHGWIRERGTTHLLLKDRFDRTYPLFLEDLADAIQEMNHGTATTWWTVYKRGNNYGIRVATEKEAGSA